MKIREGAYHRTRGGDVFGPMYRNDLDAVYPWSVLSDSWTDDGRFNVHAKENVGDIISEVYVSDTPPADAPAPEAKTLRDEFAMAALTGMLAREDYYARHVARDAYEYAYEMMEARKK